MEQNKILTIIIPTYNMEKYLRKCLDSLIVSEENMGQLEVLVVNDGSKDSSSQIAHEYETKYPQTFRVIDKDNGNYGSCINKGLKEAKGKYVKILDADDYFDKVAFGIAIKFLAENDYDLILTDYNRVTEEGIVKKMFELTIPHNTPLTIKDLLGFSAQSMHMHRIFYKTGKLRSIGYHQTEGMSYTDQEWMGEPMTTVNSLYYMDICLYQYLVGREEQTINPLVLLKSIKQYFHAIYVLLEFYNKYQGDKDHKKYLWYRIYGQSIYMYTLFLCENKNIDLAPLCEFDDKLKSLNEGIYKDLENITYSKFKFIKHWRKRKYSRSSSCLVSYFKLVTGSEKVLKSIFGI